MHANINNLLLPLSSTQSLFAFWHSTDAWHWNIYSFDIFVQNVTVINNFFVFFHCFQIEFNISKIGKSPKFWCKILNGVKERNYKIEQNGIELFFPKNFIEYQKI